MRDRMKRLLAAGLLALALPVAALAENSTLVGGYTIHHNAMTTDTLTPQIAQMYDIQRSANRGMISVTVLGCLAATIIFVPPLLERGWSEDSEE